MAASLEDDDEFFRNMPRRTRKRGNATKRKRLLGKVVYHENAARSPNRRDNVSFDVKHAEICEDGRTLRDTSGNTYHGIEGELGWIFGASRGWRAVEEKHGKRAAVEQGTKEHIHVLLIFGTP